MWQIGSRVVAGHDRAPRRSAKANARAIFVRSLLFVSIGRLSSIVLLLMRLMRRAAHRGPVTRPGSGKPARDRACKVCIRVHIQCSDTCKKTAENKNEFKDQTKLESTTRAHTAHTAQPSATRSGQCAVPAPHRAPAAAQSAGTLSVQGGHAEAPGCWRVEDPVSVGVASGPPDFLPDPVPRSCTAVAGGGQL